MAPAMLVTLDVPLVLHVAAAYIGGLLLARRLPAAMAALTGGSLALVLMLLLSRLGLSFGAYASEFLWEPLRDGLAGTADSGDGLRALMGFGVPALAALLGARQGRRATASRTEG